jgi:eukaryotic-like serine/threonine-protein kinase
MADSPDTEARRDLMALFAHWFDAGPAERTAMLDALALSSPEQHARLQAMIDADGEAASGELLGVRNAAAAIASMLLNPAAVARPGARFGPWELREPIGTGGMAQVWLATRSDGLHSGSAAIKLLHGSPVAGPAPAAARARFARKGELLARLVHPHVAQLLDAGQLDDGTRYLVLEHVRGERIDRWCDARRPQGRAAPSPPRAGVKQSGGATWAIMGVDGPPASLAASSRGSGGSVRRGRRHRAPR